MSIDYGRLVLFAMLGVGVGLLSTGFDLNMSSRYGLLLVSFAFLEAAL